MESARAVSDRWTRRSVQWGELPQANVIKAFDGSTDMDDLPLLSRVAARSERAFWKGLLEAWHTTASHVSLAELTQAVDRGAILDAERHLRPDLSAHLMREDLEPRLQTVFRHGIDVTAGQLRDLGVQVKQLHTDLQQPYAEAAAWARRHAGELITHVSEGQREAVRTLIVRANEEGIDPEHVARLLRNSIGLRPDQAEKVNQFRARLERRGVREADVERRTERYAQAQQRARARLIARSELIRSVNAGQQSLWTEAVRTGGLPRNVLKRWIVTEDEMLCGRCEDLGFQEPIPVGQEFAPGVMHPGLHPNCRCSMALVMPEASNRGRPTVSDLAAQLRTDADVEWNDPGTNVPFDGFARQLIRHATTFWETIPTDPNKFVWHTATAMDAAQDIELVKAWDWNPLFEQNVLGMYDFSTKTLSINRPMTRVLKKALKHADTPEGRAAAYKALAQTPYGFRAVETVIHESGHAKAYRQLSYALQRRTIIWRPSFIFIEEGTNELLARRYTTALLYGKTGKRPAWLAREVTGCYQPYVEEVLWYERQFGNKALHELRDTVAPDRERVAARRLQSIWPAILRRSPNLSNQEVKLLVAQTKEYGPYFHVRMWQEGITRYLAHQGTSLEYEQLSRVFAQIFSEWRVGLGMPV